MFYMYVIPGFNFTNYESQSILWYGILTLFFKFTNPPFLFLIHPFYGSTLFIDKPSDPTLFYKFEISFTPPCLKDGLHTVWNCHNLQNTLPFLLGLVSELGLGL